MGLDFKYIDDPVTGAMTMQVTMPYAAAVTLANSLCAVLAEPMPAEPVPAEIELKVPVDGKPGKELRLIITPPPVQQKASPDTKLKTTVCADCMASACFDGTCDACGAVGLVAPALCTGNNVCTRCLANYELLHLTSRLN